MAWHAVTGHRAQLGEGPFWDVPTQALYWVDIAGKQALRLIGANVQIWQMPEHVSAFIPCESGDALVTLSSGVYRLDLDSPGLAPRLTLLCVADPQPGNRGNEARCDAQGRLWPGTMQNNIGENGEDLPVMQRSGGLFRIDRDARVTPLLRGLGIPTRCCGVTTPPRCTSLTASMARSTSISFAPTAASSPRKSGLARMNVAARMARRWMPRLPLECTLGRQLPAQVDAGRSCRSRNRIAGQPSYQLRVRWRRPENPVHHQRCKPA